MKLIRRFSRPNSVFYDFVVDTPQLLEKAWNIDSQFLKLHKFIKDGGELAATMAVLKKYYP